MTVDELIAALEDTKRLDPTIGGWEVRMEMTVAYEDDNYRQARLDGSVTITESVGTIVRDNGKNYTTPSIRILPEATA